MKDENGVISRIFVIVTDITAQKKIMEEMKVLSEERLQNQIEQQKEITRATLQAQETERNDLGRELHDNINQLLAAVNLQLSYCIDNYTTAGQVIRESRSNIQQAMEEIRNLSHKMVMPRFSATSLQDELNGLIANYRFTQDIQLETKEWDEETIPQSIKETFFRIAQEKLSNIYKHAQAKQITIHIKNDAGSAFMRIKDDGIGFDPALKRKGIGITNIINRVEAYNGTCQLVSAPGKGCTLSVSIPYDPAN
jgi:two-component system sensor histidine kinase UhpB